MKFDFSVISRLRFFVLMAIVGLLGTACEKEEVKDYTQVDENIIKNYVATNNITNAQRQPSGLYYVPVTTDTSAVRATAGKIVSVTYTGALLDGTVFDASTSKPITFRLGRRQVIDGWDEGIALMRKGEKGRLFIPSALGYGASGSYPSIPPNAVLRFDVQLVDVQ